MITAIPVHKGHLAGHFTKAEQFQFIDDQGIIVGSCANPALGTTCIDKNNLLSIFEQYKAERIIVWNIGERMLGKLMSKSLRVYKALNPRQALAEFTSPATENLMELTQSTQGRPSRNYHAKQHQRSECCCGHETTSDSDLKQACPNKGNCCSSKL